MAAAVSDFTPASPRRDKTRKGDIDSIKLKKTPDILKDLGARKGSRLLVGFAAESSKDIESAKHKLKAKKLDMIILNDISEKGAGFDVDTNIVTIIDKEGNISDYPIMKKIEIADIILDRILALRE
jgi:phosphopantothenoylcysteine decarboxylase/phosphopantothenate--cysteine ligase